MIIKTLATGSKGNCYIIQGINESIMIECGIPFKEIMKKVDYCLSDISCVLVSHEHQDHAKAINEMLAHGKIVFSSPGTFNALNIDNYLARTIKPNETIETYEFTIKVFNTEHDSVQPIGFLIQSKIEYKKILFATDTYFLKYVFSDIDCFMLEINHIEKHLDYAVKCGKITESGANRIKRSHMNLERAIKFLNAMKEKRKLRINFTVMPIHTSSRFANNEEIIKALEENFVCDIRFDEEVEV